MHTYDNLPHLLFSIIPLLSIPADTGFLSFSVHDYTFARIVYTDPLVRFTSLSPSASFSSIFYSYIRSVRIISLHLDWPKASLDLPHVFISLYYAIELLASEILV